MKTAGTGWADGYLNVSVTLEQTSNERQKVDDIRLTLPVAAEVAQFAMGLGRPGGFRPRNTTVGWSWGNEIKRQDFLVWLGSEGPSQGEFRAHLEPAQVFSPVGQVNSDEVGASAD